ncbi:MAG TPA: hypothetical protein VMI31_18375 [Fimbriimonadaceae bacterium]|nr:hypothetical protein [Fimbriimonadaceae bacterium]
MQPIQPKINQKLLLRVAICLFLLAIFVGAFWWFKLRESDPGGYRQLNTVGWIAALETTSEGNHVVVLKGDDAGTVINQPNVKDASEDRAPVWRPDGNYVYFPSNRQSKKFTMFRWFPAPASDAEMRSLEGLPQLSPSFLATDSDLGEGAMGLLTAGGRVMMYDPKTPALRQVLPPPDPKLTQSNDPEAGQVSPFETMYERFGNSFRVAKWTPDKQAVFAVMEREDGEVLIYQKLRFKTPQEGQPIPIAQGDHIDFDIDPNTGAAYFTVENFQWPLGDVPSDFLKNGKVMVPFRNGLAVADFSQQHPIQWIKQSKDNQLCFGALAVAPKGDRLVTVVGPYQGNGNMTPKALWMLGLSGPGRGQMAQILQGEVYEPCWSPDEKKIAYAERDSKTSRPIYVLTEGSSGPERVSPADGVFGHPQFSPQTQG